MGYWCKKLLLMVQKKSVIDFKYDKRKKKISQRIPKIKNKTHVEIYNRKIQQNQNSTDFMSR